MVFNEGQVEQRATSTGLIPYPNPNHTDFKRCLCKLCSKSSNDAIFCHLNKYNYLNILREQSRPSTQPVLPTNLTFRGPCIVIHSYNESQ